MRPLDGVRIIDLTVAVAGPVSTALLGDLGAEVIRVEPPWPRSVRHLEVAPAIAGAADHPYNRIISYNDLHRSKRAISLDLASAAGRDVLLRLVGQSDAVIENMSPRVLPALGLAYEALVVAKPDIVLVRMPAFGEGPLRDRVSYGPGIDAMSGLSHLTGYADRGPMNPANYYADYNTALLAALATLAALRHRDRTGEGQSVEVAMLEGEMQVVADALLDYAVNGRIQKRGGNTHPSMAPHGVYRCAGDDRWLAIACENDEQWVALCRAIGRAELASDAQYADVVSRIHNRAEIDAVISDWTCTQDAVAAMASLEAAGVPAGLARTVAELAEQVMGGVRGFLQLVEHPAGGTLPHARAAFTLSKTPARIAHAPLYAQDADYVFRGLLRMSAEEVARLAEAGVTALSHPTPR